VGLGDVVDVYAAIQDRGAPQPRGPYVHADQAKFRLVVRIALKTMDARAALSEFVNGFTSS